MRNLGREHANLDQQAYHILRSMIRDRRLLPGTKIPQEGLAKELGISRTPLVNALKRMENEKLIESKPRRGFYVRLFSKDEMVSIFELREVLEGLAARHAADNATEENISKFREFFRKFKNKKAIEDYKGYSDEDRSFHNYVTEMGAKEFLKSILRTYNIISFSYQVPTSEGLVRSPDETIAEHLDIIDAICDRDPVSAESLMRKHFKRSIAALKREQALNDELDGKMNSD